MAHEAVRVPSLTLPISIVEPSDVRKTYRELEGIDEFLRQASLRKSGASPNLPRTTKSLDDMAELNALQLLDPVDRAKAMQFLETLLADAPVIHISFAAEPSMSFTTKVITWLRKNIHPLVLMQIGLQPSIGAGCIVRTENKVFDFSLRQYLVERKAMLTQAIEGMGGSAEVSAVITKSEISHE